MKNSPLSLRLSENPKHTHLGENLSEPRTQLHFSYKGQLVLFCLVLNEHYPLPQEFNYHVNKEKIIS
jgi:hypothetical protein